MCADNVSVKMAPLVSLAAAAATAAAAAVGSDAGAFSAFCC